MKQAADERQAALAGCTPAEAEVDRLRNRVRKLELALTGVMDSAECYFLRDKPENEYDEYDMMMAPRWAAARSAMSV